MADHFKLLHCFALSSSEVNETIIKLQNIYGQENIFHASYGSSVIFYHKENRGIHRSSIIVHCADDTIAVHAQMLLCSLRQTEIVSEEEFRKVNVEVGAMPYSA